MVAHGERRSCFQSTNAPASLRNATSSSVNMRCNKSHLDVRPNIDLALEMGPPKIVVSIQILNLRILACW